MSANAFMSGRGWHLPHRPLHKREVAVTNR